MAASGVTELRRFVPLAGDGWVRSGIGFVLGIGAIAWSLKWEGRSSAVVAGALFLLSWSIATALTDKYRHKYPYRYDSYLLASHLKAAAVMALPWALGLWLLPWLDGWSVALWSAFGWFHLWDLLVSLPRRRAPIQAFDPQVLASRAVSGQATLEADVAVKPNPGADTSVRPIGVVGPALPAALRQRLAEVVPGYVDAMETVVIGDRHRYQPNVPGDSLARIIVIQPRLNDIRRIIRYLKAHAPTLVMGGYLVAYYEPLEAVRDRLATRWRGLFRPAFLLNFAAHRALPKLPGVNRLYFALTRGRGRNLSRAEVWGRLSFCGFRVVSEVEVGAQRAVIAHRVALPIENRRPSYYPLVGLTKVGLDGQLLQTHKVRSMYPFSEFLQKQIFEDNGLVGTGKFKNDFRLTEYGKFLRRHWIDELPQLYDWLRGDIKLVGIRATSPHFLSLYPADFIENYIRVKPGLVPPLFAEGTDGFDQIVEIERAYLKRYARAPLATDLRLLWDTFVDIVFRGVRSK